VVPAPPVVTETRLDAVAGACTFLSRLFLRRADDALLAAVADPDLVADWPLDPDDATARGLELMHRAAVTAGPHTLAELTKDYEVLFVGPGHVLACPYESVYRSEEHLTFERETLAVRGFYARFGVQAPALNREPDDHIGLELDFIAHLCVLALDALDDGDAEMAAAVQAAVGVFLREHLLCWVVDCLDRVDAGATTPFYRGVGLLARGSVEQLRDAFAG
jgi:TorA maturation chaperone TorD